MSTSGKVVKPGQRVRDWRLLEGAAVVCIVLCCTAESVPTEGRLQPLAPGREVVSHSLASGVSTANFWTPFYSMRAQVDATGQSIRMSSGEMAPSPGSEAEMPTPYETWDLTLPTFFTPSAVAFRTGNEIYVAGTDPAGNTTIQRWDFPRIQGMYYSERLTLALPDPFGIPLTTGPLNVAIEGGTYIQPAQRPAPVPSKSTLYSGTSIGLVSAMGVDPDGRFLLLVDHVPGSRLVQLRLTTPVSVHVIATQAQYPELAEAEGPRPIDQSTVGRMYVLSLSHSVIWVEDPTNDGILDQVFSLDTRQFYSTFPQVTWSMSYP